MNFRIIVKLSNGNEIDAKIEAENEDAAKKRLGEIPEFLEFTKNSKIISYDITLEDKKSLRKNDYVLQKSDRPNIYIVADVANELVISFEVHKFNETREVTFLEDKNLSAREIATILRNVGEWLSRHHYFVAMPIEKQHRIIIGKKIEQLRKDAGMTQQELANKCGIDCTHIGKIENGRFNFTMDTLFSISKALGKEIEFI